MALLGAAHTGKHSGDGCDWLGIQDVDDLDFVIFIGLAITPAIGAWRLTVKAFRRRNLAKDKKR